MWITKKKFDELEEYNNRLFNKNLELRSDLHLAEGKFQELQESSGLANGRELFEASVACRIRAMKDKEIEDVQKLGRRIMNIFGYKIQPDEAGRFFYGEHQIFSYYGDDTTIVCAKPDCSYIYIHLKTREDAVAWAARLAFNAPITPSKPKPKKK